MLIENLRLAFTSLKANKSRAFLTMLGIIIGIASVIAIMTVGNSLTNSVSESMQDLGANNITVYITQRNDDAETKEDGTTFGKVSYSSEITEDDYITDEMIYSMVDNFKDEIEAISAEESVGTYTMTSEVDSEDVAVNITGVSIGYFKANSYTMLAGETIDKDALSNARNAAVVSNDFVEDMWGVSESDAVGKDFTLKINNEDVTYTIVGVYENEQNSVVMMGSAATSVFIPLTTAQNFNHTKNYSSISVVSKVGVDSDKLSDKIKSYLEGFYRSNRYVMVETFSMASMVSVMSDMMGTITLAISVIAGIALLVGGIGVMNIMLVSITERTREIGTRKALGATNSSIRTQFIVEAMIICLIGGIIGVILGITMGYVAANLLGYPASPSVTSIIGSLLFSIAIGVFFGYYPANKAAKMNPIDALRYE
ncbi:MAG: ABC transporter permease [Lachnospiraceae bacterium]|nr:ABC transporter permease [Lachnospiraceae bacterium]